VESKKFLKIDPGSLVVNSNSIRLREVVGLIVGCYAFIIMLSTLGKLFTHVPLTMFTAQRCVHCVSYLIAVVVLCCDVSIAHTCWSLAVCSPVFHDCR